MWRGDLVSRTPGLPHGVTLAFIVMDAQTAAALQGAQQAVALFADEGAAAQAPAAAAPEGTDAESADASAADLLLIGDRISLSWVKEGALGLVAKKIKFCRSYKPIT